MTLRPTILLPSLAVLVLAATAPTGAQQAAPKIGLPAIAIIETRQAGYALQGGLAAAIKDGIKHDADPKVYVDAANAFVDWGNAIPALFPVGTEKGGDTAAKPEIWSDRTGFEKDAANFTAAAKVLAERAKAGDKPGFANAFQEMGKTCGACHRAYRVKTS